MHDLSWRRLVIFLLNVVVVGYLLKHQLAEGFSHQKESVL